MPDFLCEFVLLSRKAIKILTPSPIYGKTYQLTVLYGPHKPSCQRRSFLPAQRKKPFDQLFMRCIRAIYINLSIDPDDNLKAGKLWLDLYRLFEESDDKGMWFYTARKASEYLAKALEKDEIQGETDRQSTER